MDRKQDTGTAGGTSTATVAFYRDALATQSRFWPDIRTELGTLEAGWTTTEKFFRDDLAITQFLEYEGSFNRGTDMKSCAAFMMTDYCYIFSAATVPLFVGFGIVPDLAPSLFALSFYTAQEAHEGHMHDVRRAHVRYLSPGFATGEVDTSPDHPSQCDLFRRAIENHFRPVVDALFAKTSLSRNALWRLAADAVAGRFLDAGRRFGCLEQAKAAAMEVLKQPGSPLNNRQLQYFDLTVLDAQQREFSYTFRARGGCCRFYLVEGGEYCPTCVLQKPKERDEKLRHAMRRHLGVTA